MRFRAAIYDAGWGSGYQLHQTLSFEGSPLSKLFVNHSGKMDMILLSAIEVFMWSVVPSSVHAESQTHTSHDVTGSFIHCGRPVYHTDPQEWRWHHWIPWCPSCFFFNIFFQREFGITIYTSTTKNNITACSEFPSHSPGRSYCHLNLSIVWPSITAMVHHYRVGTNSCLCYVVNVQSVLLAASWDTHTSMSASASSCRDVSSQANTGTRDKVSTHWLYSSFPGKWQMM